MTKFENVPLLHFRFLFKKAREVVRNLDYPSFASPYSVIPLISQAIGLEIPMMGSGNSPYSIISYSAKLQPKMFLSEAKNLPYKKRRGIIDEITEMIAPYLLDERENYIGLLLSTKYKNLKRDGCDQSGKNFRNIL